ncbi:YceI family protein [Sinomicrobium pectinilyticum]|uniref:YceI family protein n=1 Tax=Sinomicrobium pectinilyticum TaxID=1084421 RepID=A0A3N0ECT1_SINP1|nr:YceI family protein [Sinomicrobium pectinilyticum]RNL85652.1 YceI family protein [Sinomicrobium pectinilyticum]
MKNKFAKAALTLVIAIGATAFTPVDKEEKKVDVTTSKITWKGYKVTGSHEGVISLKEGSLIFEGDKLTGGEFVVDMTSLTSTDLEGDSRSKLDGHLKSDDFFGVETHPTSKLIITKVKASGKNAYKVTGDLTIKGKTHPVTFDLSVYGNKATGALKIDRSKYDVRYGSGSFFDNLGDKTIYDEFDLVVDLNF